MQQNSLKVVLPIHVINTQTLHIQALINTMNLSMLCQRLAGRVAHFLPNWEVLTQDQWVLQTVAGYQLELTTTPYQTHVPHQIRCSPENKVQITTEVQELLDKGAILETQLTPQNFVSQIFLVEKKGGGQRPVINLKGLNQFVKTEHFKMERALQDGRPSPTPRFLTATRLDGKDGSEGCIPSDPYSSRPSTPSHLPMGREDLHVSMPTLWSLSSTQGVHKTAETSGRLPETKWLSPHNILRRHATAAPGQGPTTTGDPTHLPIIGELGVNGKPEKIHTDTNPGARISGLPSVLSNNETLDSLREIKEDPTGCQASAGSRICVSKGNSKVCGQSYGYHESHPIGPIALQSPPTIDELYPSPELHPGRNINQIRNSSNTDSSQQERLRVVDRPQEGPTWGTSVSPRPNNNDTLGCIQQGLGCSAEWSITDGGLWSPEEATHHINYLELLATFLAIKAFGKAWQNVTILLRLDNVTAVSYINQKGGTVSQLLCQLALTIWTWCVERNITLLAEHLPGHLNIQADEESRTAKDRCDWMLNQSIFQRINSVMGPLEMDLFASCLTKQLPRFYSWRPDPEAEATDAFMQNWAAYRGFANPPWCLYTVA